ncbi:hypothetical protein ACVIHD_006035 [Bradyrhizobium embrapense]
MATRLTKNTVAEERALARVSKGRRPRPWPCILRGSQELVPQRFETYKDDGIGTFLVIPPREPYVT